MADERPEWLGATTHESHSGQVVEEEDDDGQGYGVPEELRGYSFS